MNTIALAPGYVIQDSYEIERLLGEGGMGTTYKGRNIASGHAVAIKVVTSALAGDERALALFKRESSLLRTVHNDAVIRYETLLQDRQGRLFLVMEYVERHPLGDYVRRGARLPPDGVLALGARLAGGLAAIHALSIVHRDVSPDNIIVPGDDIGGAKLIDFGLASDTIGSERSIIGDSFAGRISYCAPEQFGLFGGRITAATDVYALGLVLMRVAGIPVPGEGLGMAGALDARRTDLRVSGHGLPPPLVQSLEAMLRADPADRPRDLPALFPATPAAASASPDLTAVSDGEAAVPAPRLAWRLPAVIGAVLLAIAVGAYLYLRPIVPAPTPGPGARAQSETARQALAGGGPLDAALALVDRGGDDNLNAALAALIELGRDAAQPADVRQRALVAVAEMYDPATHDPARSPFPQPNPGAAARFYQQAADLGSPQARDALERLKE